MAVCRICREAESKYKCPACKAPYCSLACYKLHKAEHEANPLPPPPPEPSAATTTTIPEAGPEDQNPFAPLLTTPLTPTLRKHLLSIHAATQKPTYNSNYRGRGGSRGRGRGGGGGHGAHEREWTEEQETKAAIEKLWKLREEGNEEIEEFVQMVVGLVEKEQGDALGQR